MSAALMPVITNVGITALIDAANRGVKATISHVAVGNGGEGDSGGPYIATAEMTGLKNEIQRVIVAGGEMLGSLQNQLHLTATIQDRGDDVPEVYPIYEIGFFLDTGELFAIYASPGEKLAEKVAGTDFVLAFDLTFTGVDASKIVVDGSAQLQMPIARDNLLMGENTVKIHTQAEFDNVFNQGEDTEIPPNTTIVLNPIQNADGTANAFNGRPAYVLNNSLLVRSNVSIIGFNQEDTLVIKGDAEARIKVIGESSTPIMGVKFSGWCFDGRGGVSNLGGSLISRENGGAIYLEYAEQCQFECKIINHHTELAGGGIYGDKNVFQITANNVWTNLANQGGGVFGCHRSSLTVHECQATNDGSGVFGSYESEIRVFNCEVDNCVDGISYINNGYATFDKKLTFSGDLTTNAIAQITPILIRGTGKNRDAARVLKIGKNIIYSIADQKGIALTRIRRTDHSIIGDTAYYDTNIQANCNTLAEMLLEVMADDELGVLTSYGNLGNAHNEFLRSAFKKLGLYQALSLSRQQAGAVPYAAIFAVNRSAAARVVESVSSNDTNAYYAEINGWLMDGSFVASGTTNNALIGLNSSGGALGAFVDHNGYVGIGTDSPVVPFTLLTANADNPVGITQNSYAGGSAMEFTTQDSNRNQATRLCLRGGHSATDIEFLRGSQGSEELSMIIKGGSGNVGIGTDNPGYPLHVERYLNRGAGFYGYLTFAHTPAGRRNDGPNVRPFSIYASERIRAKEFNAFSDARIKRIVGKSDRQSDLDLLLQLQVTDYQYIDHLANGHEIKKGLIAQQVEAVFPQSVQHAPDFIPDVFCLCERVVFDQKRSELTIYLTQTVTMVVGDQVQLIEEKLGYINKRVVGVASDRQSFTVGEWEEAVEKVFIYGKQVEDFRSIDHDRILMLCVSAAQAQQEQQQKLAHENQALTAKVEQMEKNYNELKSEFATLKTMLLRDVYP